MSDYAAKPAKPGRPDILIPGRAQRRQCHRRASHRPVSSCPQCGRDRLARIARHADVRSGGAQGGFTCSRTRAGSRPRCTGASSRTTCCAALVIGPIWERYVANGFKPLGDVQSDGIPLEFSHAAYRLGHSMVRMSYVFNDADHDAQGEGIRDVLKTTVGGSARRSFLPTPKWIAEWSKFFEIEPHAKPQPSRRIGPCFNEVLLDDGIFSNPAGKAPAAPVRSAPTTEPSFLVGDHSGLLLRDLIRGTIGGLLTPGCHTRNHPARLFATALRCLPIQHSARRRCAAG